MNVPPNNILTYAPQYATNEALGHNLLVTQIASSLNSPRLAVRKLVVEFLTF